MAKKKKLDFNEWVQDLMRFAEFKKEREQITLMPNCYRLGVVKYNSLVARGCIDKFVAVVGSSGEIIAEFEPIKKKQFCSSEFLRIIETIFDCNIDFDEAPEFVKNDDLCKLECDFIFVPAKEFFPENVIWPFHMDKTEPETQLFYKVFDEEDKNSFWDYEAVHQIIGNEYKTFLERYEDTDGEIYIPFYSRRHNGYKPVVRLGKFLRPVPILCGADFSALVQMDHKKELGLHLCCANEDVYNFCRYMRAITCEPGRIFGTNKWFEVERTFEYSKLFDGEGGR